ncbi:MAG: translation initiation factor IF-2 [Lachnospiraceae bacterium]|jgi:translation initiation factor IF-2|nr:translation initiation factor IF-2 [Lachnospiraceae bacterium]
MAKMKVHELAKELNLPSKELLTFLNNKGIDVKVAQSVVSDDAITMVRKKYGNQAAVTPKASALKPEVIEPKASKPEVAKPLVAKPEPTKPEPTSTPAKPETVRSENNKQIESKKETTTTAATATAKEAAVTKKSGVNSTVPGVKDNAKALTALVNETGGKTTNEPPPASVKGSANESAPGKRKRIIISLNPENTGRERRGDGRSGGGGGGRDRDRGGDRDRSSDRDRGYSRGGRMGGGETPHKIIKPITAPSAVESTQPERKAPPPKRRPQPATTESKITKDDIVTDIIGSDEVSTLPAVSTLTANNTVSTATDDTDKEKQTITEPRQEKQDKEQTKKTGERVNKPQGEQSRPDRTRSDRNRSDGGSRPEHSRSEQPRSDRSRSDGSTRPERSRSDGGTRADRPRSDRPRSDGTARPSGGRQQDGVRRVSSPNYSSDRRSPQQGSSRPGGDTRPMTGERGDTRGTRPGGGRPGSSGRHGSGRPGVPGRGQKAGEGSKHQDSTRRQISDRDRRSKKEFRYVDEDVLANTRQRRVGAFIRPEKQAGKDEEQIKVITLPEILTIKELAEKMRLQPSGIVKKLFLQGQIVNVNTEISYTEAEEIAIEYDIICEQEIKIDIIEELLKEDDEDDQEMVKRPPIICVMGHVDHGKTSLLDSIRRTRVIEKESGGITQHIGAYTVEIHGQTITFLDTPGHEAFTAMRMRGATATDIAVLVVAADDGVMPQTKEAISHARAAGIEIIVAINKIDKPSANPDRVKQEMTEYELIPTDWGGQTEFVPVSAKSGEGIENLLETIILTADILELKANPHRQARGMVIEAELDKGRGPVATVLVRKGTLHVGDFISAGACYGKVRAMVDDKGERVKSAFPSMPVEILGLSGVPTAGEIFLAHETDKTAKTYAETYQAQSKVKKLEETKAKMSLDDLFSKIQAGNLKELNIIVKADVQGSVEAVKESLLKLSNEEVVVKCIHGGVGAINESDVSLASTSSAIIIGFNVRPDVMAKTSAEREGVDIRLYKVIYQAIEDIEAAMKGMLDPIFEEKVLGHAEIRQIFRASAIGNISGSYVLDGIFVRNCKVRISREGEQIYEGELASLKRFKDDVKEVRAGYECGLVFDGFDQVMEYDIVEAYTMVEVPR